MSWFSFGNDKDITTDVLGKIGAVGTFIDEMNLTDEERVKANVETVISVQEFVKSTLDENTERSKSRRDIANTFLKFYLSWCSVAFAAWFVNKEYSEFLIGSLTGLALGGAFTGIMIFHFGSHGMVRLNNSRKNK